MPVNNRCWRNASSLFSSPTFGIMKKHQKSATLRVHALFNPFDDPLLKEALKEPVAFAGGMFAGLLRLDLKEEPLKEWIVRTVEAAGITSEEIVSEESRSGDDAPQEILID